MLVECISWVVQDRSEEYCRFCRHYPGIDIGLLTMPQFWVMYRRAVEWDMNCLKAMAGKQPDLPSFGAADKITATAIADNMGLV